MEDNLRRRKDREVTTSKKAGKAASKVLRSPKSTKVEKRAAASDLAQRPRKDRKR